MANLNFIQKVAKAVGKKTGPNTWFDSDITNPDNQCVQCTPSTSIALGAVTIDYLSGIAKEGLQDCLSNTFAPPLD